ncbi:MAG: hypothetical protein ABIJ37_07435 [Pseudomonadota bacterium]
MGRTIDFNGLTDWFEIFRTGTWTSSEGDTEEYTTEKLDKIVETYNPTEYEAPLVIGHPKTDDPAFGWIEAIKREGDVLLAKSKEVDPEFEDMVRRGRFKKRSIKITPDFRLKHIGFLGAKPPAVQGLKNINFKEDEEGTVIEFSEWKDQTIGDVFRRLREWLIEKFGQDTADRVVPDWSIEEVKMPSSEEKQFKKKEEDMSVFKQTIRNVLGTLGVDISKVPDDALPDDAQSKTYNEAEVIEIRRAAEEKARKDAEAAKDREYAEKQKEERAEKRKQEVKEYCEALKKDGRLIPAWEKMGLQEFMLQLDGEDTIEFAEGKKSSRLNWFKSFMEELPKVINFEEIATRDKDVGGAGSAGEKLAALTQKKMEENKELTYGAAFAEAQKDNPDLAREYAAEIQQEVK